MYVVRTAVRKKEPHEKKNRRPLRLRIRLRFGVRGGMWGRSRATGGRDFRRGPGVQSAKPSYLPEASSPASSEVPSLEGSDSEEPAQGLEQYPSREEDEQQSPSYYYHFEEEQHNPPSSSAPEEHQRLENRNDNSNSSGSHRKSREPEKG